MAPPGGWDDASPGETLDPTKVDLPCILDDVMDGTAPAIIPTSNIIATVDAVTVVTMPVVVIVAVTAVVSTRTTPK